MTSSQSELEIESGCQTTLQRRSKDLERKRWPWIKSARKKTVLLEMKTSTSLTLLLLTVLTCVRSEEFTGYEGGAVVINCPYEKGYESYPKYLVKGGYKDGVELIRSTSRSDWTHKERFSLQDKKNRNMFSVTIRQLTLEDAGTYNCGVDTWGSDVYTTVNLKVVKPTTVAIPLPFTKVTKEVTTVALTHTPVATHNATSGQQLNITESERITDFQSEPTTASLGGHVANLSGGLGAAVVLFALLLLAFILMKSRARRKGGSRSNLPGSIRPGSGVYSEILLTPLNASDGHSLNDRHSNAALTSIYALVTSRAPAQNPASATVSNQHPQHTTTSMQAANHLPQPTIAGDDTYCLATNQTPALPSGLTSATSQHPDPTTAATGSYDIYSLATNPTPALPLGVTSATNQHLESVSATCATGSDRIYSLATNPTQSIHAPALSATSPQQSDPAIYGNLVSANENSDGCEYAMVVLRDSASTVRFSKCPGEEEPVYSGTV